jgi:ketosteroid isomerase-like protein
MDAMTDDCVFESTTPPDGTRHEGQRAVRAAWIDFFGHAHDAHFATEELLVCGDRAVTRWCYTWAEGHVRGVDVYRVRAGRVAEKLSYVKG